MIVRYTRGRAQLFYPTGPVRWNSTGTSGDVPPIVIIRRAKSQILPRMARIRYLKEPAVTLTFP